MSLQAGGGKANSSYFSWRSLNVWDVIRRGSGSSISRLAQTPSSCSEDGPWNRPSSCLPSTSHMIWFIHYTPPKVQPLPSSHRCVLTSLWFFYSLADLLFTPPVMSGEVTQTPTNTLHPPWWMCNTCSSQMNITLMFYGFFFQLLLDWVLHFCSVWWGGGKVFWHIFRVRAPPGGDGNVPEMCEVVMWHVSGEYLLPGAISISRTSYEGCSKLLNINHTITWVRWLEVIVWCLMSSQTSNENRLSTQQTSHVLYNSMFRL